MIIIIGLFIIFAASWGLWRKFRNPDNILDAWFMAPVSAGILLGIALLVCLFNRADTIDMIQQFNAAQTTLSEARGNKDISAIELAAIQGDVIECNKWLADSQYWAKKPLTSWFVHPDVLRLRPIK